MSRPIEITSGQVGRRLAAAQSETAKFIWGPLNRSGSFILADAVGTGKSYVALSLAMGQWRASRKGIFRILVLAPPIELCDSWMKKLAGNPSSGPSVGRLARVDELQSFTKMYMRKGRRPREFVVYRLRRASELVALQEFLRSSRKEGRKAIGVLTSGRRPRGGRVECLITSPGFIKKLRKNGIAGKWRKWIANADFVIADEVFQAKNSATAYGTLLQDGRCRYWPQHRPPMIGLSATLLSKDLPDARSVLELALNWRQAKGKRKALLRELPELLDEFRNSLSEGIKRRDKEGRERYERACRALEGRLRQVLVRAIPLQKREVCFWPGGHEDEGLARLAFPTSVKSPTRFPVPNADQAILRPLRERVAGADRAVENLAWFLRGAAKKKGFAKDGRKISASEYRSWTAVTESPGSGEGKKHPKLDSLKMWLGERYKENEKGWLSGARKDPYRFKTVVFVHHVRTAACLNPRSTQEANRELARKLNIRMRETCLKLARELPGLFQAGDLMRPTPRTVDVLSGCGWNLKALLDRNRTLLLASLLNAYNAPSRSVQLKAVKRTLKAERDAPRSYAERFLLSSGSLREEVFRNYRKILSYDKSLKKRKRKTRLLATVLLDPARVPSQERRRFLSDLEVNKENYWELLRAKAKSDAISRISMVIWRWIWRTRGWCRLIERANKTPSKVLRKLLRTSILQRKAHHAPDSVAVLTGADTGNRDFITDRFRGPGNPLVLVLTHVCQFGIDLHSFCWDVLHYSPAWTPHEAEQKTGRIDRPRLPATLRQLRLGPPAKANKIRIHHMIWPFTYDERMLSRLNVRAQYAERLLGSKVKSDFEDEASRALEKFRPLRISVA